ncbi:MAG: AI-2E family transporter [Candidatus Nanoarchaeia archaeon]|nr:AI-2E family transporter [Candidatus Nanoarchaeia archaeon]
MKLRNQYQKTVPFILFIFALILLFKLIQPLITIILSATLLAYITHPLSNKIKAKIKNQTTSIILALTIISLIILIPFSFIMYETAQQGNNFYSSISTKIEGGELFGFGCTSAESKVCEILNQAERFSKEKLSTFGIDDQIEKILPVIQEKIVLFILSVPLIVAEIFITLVITFFMLKDWRNIIKKISDIIPMRLKTKKKLMAQFENITHTVIYAQLFVAVVQGIVGMIGFYIFGIPFPIILGAIMAFCALIPTIGTALIWLPASGYLILMGYFYKDYVILMKGIGLLLYGLLIISTIDNILLAKIVHQKTKVNQIVVILGVIGGAALFGVPGLFIGPIMLPLLMTYFETFKERFTD